MMTTYQDIQKIYRLEKQTSSLQKINDDFYPDALEILSKLEEKHRKHLTKLITDIYNRRENKIILQAIRAQRADIKPPANITTKEMEIYNEIVGTLAKHRQKNLVRPDIKEKDKGKNKELNKKLEHEKKVKEDNKNNNKNKNKKIKIRILKTLPSIIGSDLKHYGPFKEDDLIEMPAVNARVLIDTESAEEV